MSFLNFVQEKQKLTIWKYFWTFVFWKSLVNLFMLFVSAHIGPIFYLELIAREKNKTSS